MSTEQTHPEIRPAAEAVAISWSGCTGKQKALPDQCISNWHRDTEESGSAWCGSFTIVDGETVAGADVGSNFFLTVDSIGQARAKATTASQYNFSAMDSFARSHVPYVIILLKCLDEWKSTHGGLPPTSAERNAFKELIKSSSRAKQSTCSNKELYVTLFKRGGGLPPLAGPVPDMKADTTSFVNLQTAYRSKALADAAAVRSRVQSLLQTLQKPSDSITSEEIDRFCKNSQYVTLLRYRNLAEEYAKPATSEIGALEDDVDGDIGLLKKMVVGLLNSWGLSGSSIGDDHIHEMVRAGASELHSIAAIMGGIASQEIIKVITKQYVPLDNTVICNGVKSTSAVFKF
ncbi:hypothetical protein BJ742DRAFT_773638 [Cladochytrium replicatum]|nr:hypothetical protein BJ742DRAFT_773638 [Cladochytrium replicatum]